MTKIDFLLYKRLFIKKKINVKELGILLVLT